LRAGMAAEAVFQVLAPASPAVVVQPAELAEKAAGLVSLVFYQAAVFPSEFHLVFLSVLQTVAPPSASHPEAVPPLAPEAEVWVVRLFWDSNFQDSLYPRPI